MNYKLGVKPSPQDHRDYPISKLVPKLNVFPTAFSLVFDKLEVHDQKDIGGCVAFSLTVVKEIQEYRQSGKYIHYSPLFIYANRAKTDYQEDGMIPSEALKNLKNNGVCEDEFLPDIVEVPKAYQVLKDNMSKELLDNAKKYRISAYAKLNNADDIKTALMQIGAVTICIPIYENIDDIKSDGIFPKPQGEILGYHEVTIVGFDDIKNSWLILNSWGSKWGNKGYCWYDYTFSIVEAWSVTDYIEPNKDEKFYKVLVGKFLKRKDAENFMKKFKLKGYLIMKNDKILIQMGAFKTKEATQKLVNDLNKKRLKPFVIYE